MMEIFKIFESIKPQVEPGHPSTKDLRRDQLLKNYDEALDILKTLMKAKQNEITYRRNLVDMLDKSKVFHDNKLNQLKQSYQNAKLFKQEPTDATTNLRILASSGSAASSGGSSSSSSKRSNLMSTTPPYPPPALTGSSLPPPTAATLLNPPVYNPAMSFMPPMHLPSGPPPPSQLLNASNTGYGALPGGQFTPMRSSKQQPQISPQKSYNDPMDIPLPPPSSSDNGQERSSLDRRLSEFLKTFGGPGGPTIN